jgi:hypothetical protein
MKRTYTILLLVLALSAALRFYTVYTEPLPSFDDEVAHFSFAAYVHDFHALPDFSWSRAIDTMVIMQGKMVNTQEVYTYQNYQQPLYYILAAPFVGLGPRGVRVFSVLLFVAGAAILMPYVIDKTAWIVFLLLPGSIVALSATTNQALMFFAACLFVVAWYRRLEALLFIGALVLVLAKATGVVIVGAAFLYLVARRKDERYRGQWFVLAPAIIAGVVVLISRLALDGPNAHHLTAWLYPEMWTARLSDAFVSGILHPGLNSGQLLTLPVAVFTVVVIGYWIVRAIIRGRLGLMSVSASAGLLFLLGFMGTSSFGQGRWLYEVMPMLVTMGYGNELSPHSGR